MDRRRRGSVRKGVRGAAALVLGVGLAATGWFMLFVVANEACVAPVVSAACGDMPGPIPRLRPGGSKLDGGYQALLLATAGLVSWNALETRARRRRVHRTSRLTGPVLPAVGAMRTSPGEALLTPVTTACIWCGKEHLAGAGCQQSGNPFDAVDKPAAAGTHASRFAEFKVEPARMDALRESTRAAERTSAAARLSFAELLAQQSALVASPRTDDLARLFTAFTELTETLAAEHQKLLAAVSDRLDAIRSAEEASLEAARLRAQLEAERDRHALGVAESSSSQRALELRVAELDRARAQVEAEEAHCAEVRAAIDAEWREIGAQRQELLAERARLDAMAERLSQEREGLREEVEARARVIAKQITDRAAQWTSAAWEFARTEVARSERDARSRLTDVIGRALEWSGAAQLFATTDRGRLAAELRAERLAAARHRRQVVRLQAKLRELGHEIVPARRAANGAGPGRSQNDRVPEALR